MIEDKVEAVHIAEEMVEEAAQTIKPGLIKIVQDLLGKIVGLAIDEVKKICEDAGVVVLVASENGKGVDHIGNYDETRIKLHLEDGIVKDAKVG